MTCKTSSFLISRRFPTKRYLHGTFTEDEEIHCLKEGGVAADARESIRRDTATATDTELKESDPFADIEEDEDELEENELVLEDC